MEFAKGLTREMKERAVDEQYSKWLVLRAQELAQGRCGGCQQKHLCAEVNSRDSFILLAVGADILPDEALDLIGDDALRALTTGWRDTFMAMASAGVQLQ